ncbi:hypothetical protein P7C70_g568, partial [Phenoliferia sp. Uapishka_3]
MDPGEHLLTPAVQHLTLNGDGHDNHNEPEDPTPSNSNGNGNGTTESDTPLSQPPSAPAPAPPELGEPSDDRVRQLEDDVQQARRDKDQYEQQYTNLLGKLTAMRATVGDKLKQDAEELDRREQEISDLRATNDDLITTVDTLKQELVNAHEDTDHVHSELEQLRLRAFDSQKQITDDASTRENALRDLQDDLERVRIEREEWEDEAMRETVRREELASRLAQLEFELATSKVEREAMRDERDREAESASNLHAVLEEFQAAKERELKTTLGDLRTQLRNANDSLADFKRRATEAELKLKAAQNDSQKLLALTKEVKDKTLLIGKLRHDAIIMNEHLTEALRRLKKDSNENSVDRQLVSNVLITFLNTPRADSKRFEMLQLISSILSWTDDQRETVGLQRASGLPSGPGIILSTLRPGKGHARGGKGKEVEDGLGENENFGQLWVEFLLKESNAAAAAASGRPPLTSANSSSRPSSSYNESVPGSPSPSGSQSPRLQDFPEFASPPLLSPTGSGIGTPSRRPWEVRAPSQPPFG